MIKIIVASPRHTSAIIMLSNQHVDMPYLWGGWIISTKEKCSRTPTYTDLYIWEKQAFCIHRKSLRCLSSAHQKCSKNKCWIIFLFSACTTAEIVQYIGALSALLYNNKTVYTHSQCSYYWLCHFAHFSDILLILCTFLPQVANCTVTYAIYILHCI